jgi:hypothetical protein
VRDYSLIFQVSNQVFGELGAASCFAFSSFSVPFCSIFFGGATDHYFWSVDREHVEGHEALSEVILCYGGSDHSCGGAHYGYWFAVEGVVACGS